ncbi:MAG: DMT family transporter [Saprospiraceae bacterium]|nr:DMT family transporter [Saprospiraceae bacterium]MCF8251036.1 DMT family transporter [Saprospiraceae bacterium]MCF8281492.1 DMT family transporter [Bacteroidales bacterium]MCF8311633.1 DMT family transporter [Saprospiraceae bacterium]MCF8440974.1 DMT family transporter [Saprospiraceae bacterium]
MFWAVVFFAVMNVCAKGLTDFPAMEIVFFRCVVSILLSFFWLKQVSVSWKGSHTLQLIGRGLAGTTALYFFFLTIQKMPLASAVTIGYTSPIFTAILAVLFLKEKMKPLQWLFFGVSFLGVVALKGFDPRVTWLFLGLGLIAAAMSGVAYVLVRSLTGKEHPLVVVFYFQLVGTVVGGLFTIFNFKMPQSWDWLLLLAVGLCAHFGQVNLTLAIQGEKVGTISSLNFLGAIFATFFGWLLFNEHLTIGNILAMLLVIAGVLLNIWASAREGAGIRRWVANLLSK